VLHDLFLGQAEVLGHARVAEVLERVAARAVVHVQPGAALQRGAVAEVGAGVLEARAPGGERREREQHGGGEAGGAANKGHGLSHASSPVPEPAWWRRASSTAAS